MFYMFKTTENNPIYINFNLLPFLQIIEESDSQTIFRIIYRKKALLIEKNFIFNLAKDEISKKLKEFSIFKLENYFINTKQILFFEEKYDKNKVFLSFYFNNYVLDLETNKARWENWRNVRL